MTMRIHRLPHIWTILLTRKRIRKHCFLLIHERRKPLLLLLLLRRELRLRLLLLWLLRRLLLVRVNRVIGAHVLAWLGMKRVSRT